MGCAYSTYEKEEKTGINEIILETYVQMGW
jgi:hypothetical protein